MIRGGKATRLEKGKAREEMKTEGGRKDGRRKKKHDKRRGKYGREERKTSGDKRLDKKKGEIRKEMIKQGARIGDETGKMR